MKTISDVLSSIKGNVNARVNEPFIGALVCSWVICNWDKLALLFFGSQKVDDRIQVMSDQITKPFDNIPSFFVEHNEVYLLPLLLGMFYVFLMPWISIAVSKIISRTEIMKHSHAVDLAVKQAAKQRELNTEKLRGDPNQKFLAEALENELALEKAKAEKAKSEASEAEAKRETEEGKAQKAKSEAAIAKADEEKKLLQAEQDKASFALSAKINKSAMQANAYISSYQLVSMLAESLGEDGVILSLGGLTKIIATVFGYDSYESLINDKEFTNDKLKELKYVLCDSDFLSKEFEQILDEENIDHDQYESTWLIQHIEMIFEKLPYNFVSEDALVDKVFDEIEADSIYQIIHNEVFASAQAETDTIIEDFELHEKSYDFGNDLFTVEIHGTGSGSHRKETDVPGRSVDFIVEANLPVKWGKFGLADYELSVKSAEPEDYR